jgi:signal transduction histidine kinase
MDDSQSQCATCSAKAPGGELSEPAHQDWTVWLAAQRHRAVNTMLVLVLLTGLVGVGFSLLTSLTKGEASPNLLFYVTAYLAIFAIFLARRLSDRLRAQLFLVVMCVFALASLLAGWLAGGGRVFLLASIVVAAILAGRSTSLVVTALAVATYVGFGLAFQQGWLSLHELADPTAAAPIIIEGIGFIMAVAMVAASQWLFGRALEAANRANSEAQAARRELADSARRLAAANQELEAFSYSVSHDLRAPLRAIQGFSRALEEDAGARLQGRDLEHLQRIRAGAARMSSLIDGLLRLSRISRAELRRQRLDLGAMAERIGTELGPYVEGDLELTVEPDLLADGDHDLLQAALANLLENACKFSSHRQTVRIQVGSLSRDGEQVFFVRDNGAGFDMEFADRLFGPFQRLHPQEEFPGEGIGLATVARIIGRHGGRIWATAEVDRGATFFFTLSA